MPPHICLFGAAPGTNNLGVDALCHSTLTGLAARLPGATFSVFDYRRGARTATLQTEAGPLPVQLFGANHSRRLWRGDTLRTMQALGRFAATPRAMSPGLAAIRAASAVLDLSGGDSFTDLYGRERFDTVTLPKRIALQQGAPLVLLPQTYGPFRDEAMRREASEVVRAADYAWARDARSFEVLRGLLGDQLDPARHRLGVDMAFGLEVRRRAGGLDPVLDRWLDPAQGVRGPVVGVNVSGLVWLSEERARSYGFKADYRDLSVSLVRELLTEPDVRVALVPHVIEAVGHYESDLEACLGVQAALGDAERVHVVRPPYEASEIKHEIARMDWFVGTRMHATIAALSTGVPAGAVAYSPKFRGIFERCDLANAVADPTQLDAREAVAHLMRAWRTRDDARRRLTAALVDVRATLAQQLDAVVAVAARSRRPGT
ncbi:MAG: polysaccharide pyruvyl transferase family protein [Planctomycetota bacterium]